MKTRTVIFILLLLFHISLLIWIVYSLWTREISLFLGIICTVGTLMLIKTHTTVYRKYSLVDVGYTLDLSVHSALTNDVTPEFITEILGKESVVQAIKKDLTKTGLIGYKEVWRLGLITPGQDRYDPRPSQLNLQERTKRFTEDNNYRLNLLEQIPLKRTAVLFNTGYFNVQFNNLFVIGGTVKPRIRSYPGWGYSLSTKKLTVANLSMSGIFRLILIQPLLKIEASSCHSSYKKMDFHSENRM
jgi:hypothetical protein